MDNVIDISEKLKQKQYLTDKHCHDQMLDMCDDFFPEGALIIAIVEGELQISSTMEDKETMLAAIIGAGLIVEGKSDES